MRSGPVLVFFACASLALLGVTACSEELPSAVSLSSQGEQIELSDERMPADQYRELGDITAEGIGISPREAEINATNDLRNRAAALHATFVSIESRKTESYGYFTGRVQMEMKGIAYTVKD